MGKKEATLDLFFCFHFPQNRRLHCVFLADSMASQLGCCDGKEQTIIRTLSLWSLGLSKKTVCFVQKSVFSFDLVSMPLLLLISSNSVTLLMNIDEVSQSVTHFILRCPLVCPPFWSYRVGLIFSSWSLFSSYPRVPSMNVLVSDLSVLLVSSDLAVWYSLFLWKKIFNLVLFFR